MKTYRRLILLMLLWTGTLFPAGAQHNPYEIDDDCYVYFMRAEASLGKDGFEAVNDTLLQLALRKGDDKAQTLYYVERLKHLTRMGGRSGSDPAGLDRDVLEAHEELKRVARQLGYPQYFYYSYGLVQSYMFNTGRSLAAMEYIQEMQHYAFGHEEDYGKWMSDRYMASLYVSQDDYVSAKRFILRAIETYRQSNDPVLLRQSPCRVYCDLADCYPVGSDSLALSVSWAVRSLANGSHLDSLRCRYYQARIAAVEHDLPAYVQARDYCLQSGSLTTVTPTGRNFFDIIDAIILSGDVEPYEDDIFRLTQVRERKYVANILERNGYQDLAFRMEKKMVEQLEVRISESSQTRVAELEARLGNLTLAADLAEERHRMTAVMRLVFLMANIILALVVLTLVFYIRNLHKNKAKDEQRIAELKAANERVTAADAAKTRFVQNMSHEVRTPLNAIVGFSQLLSLPDGSFPPEEKEEFSTHIVNNAQMLTMLLDDILNASAMDADKYRIVYEDGECHFICQAAIRSAEHRLQPGVRMYYDPENEAPFTFRTDPRRVQQVLINLLTNACKHTEKGEIRLSSSCTERPGFVTFAVSDTGPGVPADKAEAIFERFVKLNEFVQGTGLGLSICRDIAARMGGRVYLDTSYTDGARFVFELPLTVNPT